MSVDHATVRGFGFVLTRDEVEASLRKLGIEWDHDEPEIELQDRYDICVRHCGSHYVEDGVNFLYHAAETRDPETGSTAVDQGQVASLKRMASECGLDKTVGFREEDYWY